MKKIRFVISVCGLWMGFLFMGIYPQTSWAKMEAGPFDVTAETTVGIEYDDNIYLESKDEGPEEDTVMHIIPSLNIEYPYDSHAFSLGLFADYRKGLSTDLSEINWGGEGLLDFNFSGGLNLKLKDTYLDTRFDQELDGEPGVSKSRSNHYGFEASYPFGERLQIEGGYLRGWEEYEEEPDVWEVDTDDFYAKLSFPITWSTVGYVSYDYFKQVSDEQKYRDYDSHHYQIGVDWRGPYRFWLGGKVGYEDIDYDDPTEEDYDDITWEARLGVKYTEIMDSEFWVGGDGYGNPIYGGNLNYRYSADTVTQVYALKQTNRSFSSSSDSATYESARFGLTHKTKIIQMFDLSLDGSYEIQDPSTTTAGYDDDKIWRGRVDVSYPWRDNIKIGTYYQYAQRDSDETSYEYENNRVGAYATVSF